MKEEILRQLEGYEAVKKDIETTEKYGNDFSSEKGNIVEYLNRLHPPKINFRISTIIDETPSTKTFRLVSKENYLPPFQAGQYISLFIDVSGIRTSRPFSISSPPNQTGYYDITVRRVENGLVSNYLLDNVKKGDVFESSGPCGTFVYNPIMHDKTIVCIAGGSGITPFMSMIREITDRGLDRTVYLFYGNKDLNDVIFHDELTHISDNFSNFFYIPVIENASDDYTGVCGLISSQLLKDTLKDLSDKSFFLCGPKGLYDFCLPALDSLDVPNRKIRQEVYGSPINICDYPGWPKEINNSDTFNVSVKGQSTIKAAAGESLLSSLEKNKILVPSICRSGDCSMCRVKVFSGKVFQPAGVPVRASDKQFGYVHSCMSFPIEDLEILI